jgi:hypothetical protein
MTRAAVPFALGLTVLSAGSALAAPDAAAGAPLVVLEGSPTIVFSDNGGTRKAVVAVKPTTARPKPGEEPSVIEFSLGELRNPAQGQPLRIKWIRAKDPANAPQALEFELDDTVRRPGAYTAYIAPLPLSSPAERVRVQIDIKPAKLMLPQKLVVARTISLLLQTSTVQPKLEVRESDRATRVPKLAVSRASAFAGTLPIAAGVTPDSGLVEIAAGQSAEVKYSVDEGVPLGTVTGALRFSATELAEPVSLDYEVRTKLTSWFIPVVIAFGFFVGWLVRKRLVDIAQLGEARERAKTLLAKVDKSLAEMPDANFHTAVRSLRDDLDKIRKGDTTAAIANAITTLDEKWRAALVEFNRRKVTATEKLAELKSLAGPPLPLPPATDQRLAAARDAGARAGLALALENVTEVERLLESEKSLTEDIWKIALAWQDRLAAIVRILQPESIGLPAPVQRQFAERAKTVTLDRIKLGSVFDTPAARRALFIDFHAEVRDARVLFSELATRIGFEWNLIAKAVEPIRGKLKPDYDILGKAVDSFQRDLEHSGDDPAPFAAALEERLKDLDTHWRTTFVLKVPADKQAALKTLADSAQYLQLANALVLTFGNLLGDDTVMRESGVVPWLTKSMERLLPPAFDRPQIPQPETPVPVEALTPSEARFLQSVLLAAIYIAVYWMLNADGFGSSMTDVATLFVTSFGLDLSAEGILKLKK